MSKAQKSGAAYKALKNSSKEYKRLINDKYPSQHLKDCMEKAYEQGWVKGNQFVYDHEAKSIYNSNRLYKALKALVDDLELRSNFNAEDPGVLACGEGVYSKAKKALTGYESFKK